MFGLLASNFSLSFSASPITNGTSTMAFFPGSLNNTFTCEIELSLLIKVFLSSIREFATSCAFATSSDEILLISVIKSSTTRLSSSA